MVAYLFCIFLTWIVFAAPESVLAGWSTVPLGGGGYVTGLTSDSSGNDIYCRSDLGGVYRWDAATAEWKCLCDAMVPNNTEGSWALLAVSSFAVDPNNSNLIYMAGGTHYGGIKGIYASGNKGVTWTAINTSLFIAGSDGYRSYGERLTVDPNNSNILWFASRQDGLQKGTRSGSTWTWTQVPSTSVPFGQIDIGIVFTACDKNSGSTIVYAGVYDSTTGGIYRSTDGGAVWSKVTGAAITTPHSGRVAANGTLFVTTGTSGVFKMPRGGTFSALSSLPTGINYHALAVDATGNSVYTAEANGMAYFNKIYRSTDGGSTWTTQVQNINNLVPNPLKTEPDGTPSCAGFWFSNVSSLLLNPADSNELWTSDFFGVTRTQDAQNLGSTNGCFWYGLQKGQEETCLLALKNSPNGARLISGVADVGGFRYLDTNERPTSSNGGVLSTPSGGNSTGSDFCESNDSVWARAWLSSNGSGSGAVSSDGGVTWMPFGGIARKTITNSATAGPETWDVGAYVANQKAKGINTVTMVLHTSVNSSTTMLVFDSRESVTSTLRPKLVINGTTDLVVAADSHVFGGAATTNYGNAASLQLSAAYASDANARWIYLKFDLSSIPSITSATLQLNRKSAANTTSFPVCLFACSNLTWVEGNGGTDNLPANEIKWTNRPATMATSSSANYMDPIKYPNYGGLNLEGGRVALSATNPNNLIWLPFVQGNKALYSKDRGATWTTSTGGPVSQMTGRFEPSSCIQQLASDRVNGNFYMARFGSGGNHLIYRSSDGGATWTQVGSIGSQFNTFRCQLVAAPGVAGEVWLADDQTGMRRSTNGGTTWAQLGTYHILSARDVAFGKPLPGSGYPYSVYFYGIYDNFTTTSQGVFRSDNGGSTWTNLGLPTIQAADALAGDRQNYGTVFLGTQGRGIFRYSLTAVPAQLETYNPPNGSSGDPHSAVTDVNASGGSLAQFDADAVGDWVSYATSSTLGAGTYTLYVGVKTYSARGDYQTSVALSGSGIWTDVGSPLSLYTAAADYLEMKVGTYTVVTPGIYKFRFTCVGKDAASTNYRGMFDYIRLQPN